MSRTKPETVASDLPEDERPKELETATLALAYEESVKTLSTLNAWYERADTKVVAIFSVSGAIAGLGREIEIGENGVDGNGIGDEGDDSSSKHHTTGRRAARLLAWICSLPLSQMGSVAVGIRLADFTRGGHIGRTAESQDVRTLIGI